MASIHALAQPIAGADIVSGTGVGFSAVEWSAVAAARSDALTTLHEPTAVAKVVMMLLGRQRVPSRLADARLEALRRAAVYAWHHVSPLPDAEAVAFRSAGFSAAQYDLLCKSSVSRA
jgi:hypothetical protein